MRPTVSVIIAARNEAATISAAIRSVLEQTLTDFEVIVVDDGSTDGTWDVARAIANEDDRLILKRNAKSLGVSRARNVALDLSRGAWVAILDADDRFKPARLKLLVEEAERRKLDVIADNLYTVEFESQHYLQDAYPLDWMAMPYDIDVATFLDRDTPGNYSVRAFGFVKPLIRRHFLVTHNIHYAEDIWLAEDFLMYLKVLACGGRFGVTPEAMYIYSIRLTSASNRRDGLAQMVEVNRRAAALFGDDVIASKLFKRREQAIRFEAVLTNIKALRTSKALKTALTISPFYLIGRLQSAVIRRLSA